MQSKEAIWEKKTLQKKRWKQPGGDGVNVRIAHLGIENQSRPDKDMPLRVIGYDGAAYRAELSKKERYPVITLVLYFGEERWQRNCTLYDVINVSEEMKPFVNDYRINVFEIAHLPEEAIRYFHSDFKVIVDYFIHKRGNPDYRPTDPVRFDHVNELLKLMAVVTQDDRFAQMLEEEGGKPKDMCEVLDRAEARGIAIGETRGIEQTRLENIKNVMDGLKFTAQQAMNLLKIPVEEQSKYLSML